MLPKSNCPVPSWSKNVKGTSRTGRFSSPKVQYNGKRAENQDLCSSKLTLYNVENPKLDDEELTKT